jgi:hypothetical protein
MSMHKWPELSANAGNQDEILSAAAVSRDAE